MQAWLSGRVDFSEFIAQKHDLEVKYELLDEDVVSLVTQIRQEAPFLKVLPSLFRISASSKAVSC